MIKKLLCKLKKCSSPTERKWLVETELYSVAVDGFILTKEPLRNVIYDLAQKFAHKNIAYKALKHAHLDAFKEDIAEANQDLIKEYNLVVNNLNDEINRLRGALEKIAKTQGTSSEFVAKHIETPQSAFDYTSDLLQELADNFNNVTTTAKQALDGRL